MQSTFLQERFTVLLPILLGTPVFKVFVQVEFGRYAICSDRVLDLGWRGRYDLESGLRETVRWYQQHRPWWEAIRSGAYRTYYEQQYGSRLG